MKPWATFSVRWPAACTAVRSSNWLEFF
jgi:hypothetical protein